MTLCSDAGSGGDVDGAAAGAAAAGVGGVVAVVAGCSWWCCCRWAPVGSRWWKRKIFGPSGRRRPRCWTVPSAPIWPPEEGCCASGSVLPLSTALRRRGGGDVRKTSKQPFALSEVLVVGIGGNSTGNNTNNNKNVNNNNNRNNWICRIYETTGQVRHTFGRQSWVTTSRWLINERPCQRT